LGRGVLSKGEEERNKYSPQRKNSKPILERKKQKKGRVGRRDSITIGAKNDGKKTEGNGLHNNLDAGGT